MSFLLVRSIPLGRRTMEAWRNAGGEFAERGMSTTDIMEMAIDCHYKFVLNLGRTTLRNPVSMVWSDPVDRDNAPFVLNVGENILPLVTPGGTRRLLDWRLPPRPSRFPAEVWVKKPGRAGLGGSKVITNHALVLPDEWDWQRHVTGQEYRLITVGNRIVQCFARYGDNGEREYHWVQMRDMGSNLKELVRDATRKLNGYNVIAWDTISTDTGSHYIFEGNSCPGMSLNTADRIVREVLRLKEEVNG